MELCHSDGYDVCHVRPIYSTLGHLITIIEKLRNEDDPDPDLPRNTIKLLLECESCLDMMAQGSSGTMATLQSQTGTSHSQNGRESCSELEVRSLSLKLKTYEQKLKNFKEKNKRFLEKNIELTGKNRDLTDNLQILSKENNKMKEQQDQSKKRIKQLTQQANHEKMTIGELELKLQEMEKIKQDLTIQTKAVTALRQACIEKDRRIDLLQHRKKKKRQNRTANKSSVGVKETFFGYDEDSMDSSETSSILSQSTISDEELCDELTREELEKNYQKLMKEHMDLQRLHNILQKYCGSSTMDPERHFKSIQQLESDLFDATLTIEKLKAAVSGKTEESVRHQTELREVRKSARRLSEQNNDVVSEISSLKAELLEAYEKIDDLEFRLVEIESLQNAPVSYNDGGLLATIIEEPGEVLNMEDSPEDSMDKEKLLQHVHSLEQTASELQKKIVHLQQEKETLEGKLKNHGSSLEQREKMEVMEAKVPEEDDPRQRAGSFDSNYSSREMSNTSMDCSGDANLSFTFNSEPFSDSCVDFDILSRESSFALSHIFDNQNMSSSDLTQLKHHLNQLSKEACKIHEENVSLKNELHNSSIRQEELEQDENKMAEILTLCKNLQEQVIQFDISEKQLRDKLKMAENTLVEMEQNEIQLRECTEKAEEREISARRQAQEYLTKTEELKEIILDKDNSETSLCEKVTILEKAELISSDKIHELEMRNQELKQRLELKEELETDNTIEKKLNETIAELQSENDSLTMRCSELEENEEILTKNWERSAQEHADRIQSLEEKIKTMDSTNGELKRKLDEREGSVESHRPSLAIELSECDKTEDDSQINQTIQFLMHRINNLESTLSSLEEAKNTKIETLQEQISKLRENEIKLSETISEMEKEERELRSQIKLNERKGYANDEVVLYEEKIHELHRSQENLIEQLDNMEDFESDLKQRMKDMEEKYEQKIEHLEKEIAQYIEQEQVFNDKLSEYEKFESEMTEKLEATDEENRQLSEENRLLIDKVLKSGPNQDEEDEDKNNETAVVNGKTVDINLILEELDEIKTEKSHVEEKLKRTETELEQIQLENDDLNERLIELDSSEQECLEQLHKYEHQAAEVAHLRKKVEVLEDAEIKLMDRVTELEEIEENLRAELDNNKKDADIKSTNRISELENIEKNLKAELNHSNKDVCCQETDTSDLSNYYIPSSPIAGQIPSNDTCIQEFNVKSFESKAGHLNHDKATDTIDLMDVKADSPGKVTGLFERLQDLENKNQTLTEQLTNLTATDKQVKQLSEKIKMLEVSEDKLMERIMELEEVEDRLRGELRRAKMAENRLSEVEQELLDVHDKMEKLETKTESLELENKTLRNELHSSGSNDESHNEGNITKIVELEHSKADLTRENEHLLMTLSEERTRFIKIETEFREIQTKYEDLKSKFEETENLDKTLKDNLNSLEMEKVKFLDAVDELEHKLHTSEEDIYQFDLLKKKLDEKIERLEDELAQVEESEFALKKDNIEVHEQNEKLTEKTNNLDTELKELKIKLQETENSKTETESKLDNAEKEIVELKSNLQSVQEAKDEIEKTIKGAIQAKDEAERKMTFAEISREQMESKLKEMDQLYVQVEANLENSKKTILGLKSKVTKAERSNMDLQLQVEKNIKSKTDAEKQLEIVRKSNSYLQSKVMKGTHTSRDRNQNSVESIHTDTCMTCGSNLCLPKQLSTFQGGLEEIIQSYRDQLDLSSTESTLPSHLLVLEDSFQTILKDFISCRDCILERIKTLQDQDKTLRDANKLLENKYKFDVQDLKKKPSTDQQDRNKSELEDLRNTLSEVQKEKESLQDQNKSELEELKRTLSEVQQDKKTLQDQIIVLEGKHKEGGKQEEILQKSENQVVSCKPETTSEQPIMTGEMEKPEDLLRQRIMELEKLEKHLKKQVTDLETDREELHEIARKDKTLIHEQNVRIRELQLAEKMHKEQISKFEISESDLYKRVEELENDVSEMEDRIQELEILEMRLKELVRKYKLDEEVWLSKSANLETSVTELTVSEKNLKQQLISVEKEKLSLGEKSEYLTLRLKELENAEASLVQRMKEQENKEKALNERLSELQNSGSNTEAQAIELHNANIVLTQQVNQAVQENAGLVHQLSQLQSQLIMVDQQYTSLQDAYSQLKDEKYMLEKSEKELENKVKEKRLSGVDIEEQLHKLEENEKTLKEKISMLQRSENRLKYKVQQMESLDSQDLAETSGNKIPHKLEECQQRLIMLRKQNIHLKGRLLEFQNLASSKSTVKLPQKEFRQMEARMALLEHTEAQLSNMEQLNAQLQQRIDQNLQGKQAPESSEELRILKERLKQNEAHLQIFRQLASDGQWDEILPILNSVTLVNGHHPVGTPGQTEGKKMKTVTSMTGQPLEELAVQMVISDLQSAPDDRSDTSEVEEYMTLSKRGTDHSKPTADEKKKLINDLISHLDKDSDDLDSSLEDIHWKTVESHTPRISQDRKWITVGQATSLHSSRPRDSHNREEELVLGLDLPSESEGYTQNGIGSNTSSPVLKRRKFLSADGTVKSGQTMPPSLQSKTPDSLSYYLPSSEQISADEMQGFVEEIKSHTAPMNFAARQSSSLHDSGHVTASTGRGTSSLRERIVEIGKALQNKSPDSEMSDDEDSLFTWKTKAYESRRNFENAEKELKYNKELSPAKRRRLRINKLEKELDEKCRYIEVLEAFVEVLQNLLCNKEKKSDREILNSVEIELHRMRENLSDHAAKSTGNDITTELRQKERELNAKRNEVDSLMTELRQWQQECRTIEDMRVNALESLQCLEEEISQSHSSEKHLKEDYNHLNEQLQARETEVNRLKVERDQMKFQISELKEKSRNINQLDFEKTSLDDRMQSMNRLLEDKSETVQNQIKEISELKVQIISLEEEKSYLQRHLQDYDHIKTRISTHASNKEELSKTVATLKVQLNQLSQKCREKDNLLRRLKDEFSQGSGKSSTLLEELKNIDKEESSSFMTSNGKFPDQNDRLLTLSEQFVQGETPRNPHFIAVSDYDPSLFSKSSHPRLELKLSKGDNIVVTGPLDDKGYFEAEVNGKIGLVPSTYLGRPSINGNISTSKDRKWQQYEKPPNHLNTTPENIVQMYGQLVKQGRTSYSSPKSNGFKTGQDSHTGKQAIPDPPEDFQAVDTERGITLSWKPPSTPVTGYKIFVDGKLYRQLTKPNLTRLVLHNINTDRDHIFGIESVCDRQVSEIIDIFYGDVETNEDRILTRQEVTQLPQRQYLGIYDYNPKKQSPRADTSQELGFNAGDSITIYGEERRDGYYYGSIEGRFGLVPSYFVEEIPKTNRQKYNIETHKYNTR